MAFEDQGSMDFKQHINLSIRAWNIVENDIADFYGTREGHLSNFLNRVFSNFHEDALSSITLTLEKKEENTWVFLTKSPNLNRKML
ncbi:hypothetical protein [Leadbettera azotonutricia]|nr:hypothetical protein [Leadbettera azotonutricia]